MQSAPFSVNLFEKQWTSLRIFADWLGISQSMTDLPYRWVVSSFHQLLRKSGNADQEAIQALQLLRLRKIANAAQTIPFWRDRFATAHLLAKSSYSLDDYRRLPIVSKEDLRMLPLDTLLKHDMRRARARLLTFRTSGTTGTPFEWGVDRNVHMTETTAFFHRAISWYAPNVKLHGRRTIASFVTRTYGQPSKEFHWDPTQKDADMLFSIMLDDMRAVGTTVLFSYPTNLLLFAKKFAEYPRAKSFDLAVVTGQRLNDDDRAYIERSIGCRVVASYGSREFGHMGIECPKHRHWYHINSERLLVEITDASGASVAPGDEGFVTVTSLENYLAPLFRYRMEDRGRIISSTCSCGSTLPILEFHGRDVDFIYLPTGERVPFRHANSVISAFFPGIEFYQLMQPSRDEFVVRLLLKGNIDRDDLEHQLLNHLRTILGPSLRISFEYDGWALEPGRKISTYVPLKRDR